MSTRETRLTWALAILFMMAAGACFASGKVDTGKISWTNLGLFFGFLSFIF